MFAGEMRRGRSEGLRSCRWRSLQKFASMHPFVVNKFNRERGLSSRDIIEQDRAAAIVGWRDLWTA